MSFFEYWHNWRLQQSEKAGQANATAQLHGDPATQDESLWQFHTEAELVQGICHLYAARSLKKSLDSLQEKGVITISRNPNPRYKFDKTRFFQFHPDVLNVWLDGANRPRSSAGTSRNNASLSGKATSRGDQFTGAIPETTTETTTETNTSFANAQDVYTAPPDGVKAPDWFQTLNALPGWRQYGQQYAHCLAWVESKNIAPARAEETALALRAKWGGPGWKYKDPWATFQHWVVRPPVRPASNGTATRQQGYDYNEDEEIAKFERLSRDLQEHRNRAAAR